MKQIPFVGIHIINKRNKDRHLSESGDQEVILKVVIEVDGKSIAFICKNEYEASILESMLENPVILGKNGR